MTTRSKRRQAELVVLEAATRLVRGQWKNYLGLGQERVLIEAVQDLQAIDLEPADTARVNRGAPLTAENAAVFMDGPRAASVAARITRFLQRSYTGATVEEMCRLLPGKHQSISARVNELRDNGWVEARGRRRNSSGVEADVYHLAIKAREMLG